MSDPQQPKYGPSFVPNNGGNQPPDPDAGKDFGNLVPNLQVAWGTPPSFNLDPPGGESKDNKNTPPCGPIEVHLGTLRDAEQTMLACSRTIVDEYEALKNKVMSSKDGVFGQHATVQQITGGQAGVDGNTYNGAGAGVTEEKTVASPISDLANTFASEINPAQEKVLFQIANAVEVVGQYIAAVNRAGQSYGHADRKSVFPDPPGGA